MSEYVSDPLPENEVVESATVEEEEPANDEAQDSLILNAKNGNICITATKTSSPAITLNKIWLRYSWKNADIRSFSH